MGAEPNAVEQAVSRTLRDNLEKVQRTADELHQAVNDLVSACASTRPSNALPSMLRAQTSAAALSATLEVLSRFVTSALQPAMRLPFEPEILRMPSLSAPPVSLEQPPPVPSHPMEDAAWSVPAPPVPEPAAGGTLPHVPPPDLPAAAELHPETQEELHRGTQETAQESEQAIPAVHANSWETPAASVPQERLELSAWDAPEAAAPVESLDAGTFDASGSAAPLETIDAGTFDAPPSGSQHEAYPDFSTDLPVEELLQSPAPAAVEHREAGPAFNLDLLPAEEQELHRRAFRVAKVSMQDIRMLRPEDVRVGRENKDLCIRLRDDIEKAHKEYDRRFQSIQGHPVDYFYDWMVEILGGGDPQALGEYPYPSPVLRR